MYIHRDRERHTEKNIYTVSLFLLFTTYYDRKESKPVFVYSVRNKPLFCTSV